MALVLPALPYDTNALEPVISANTLGFHYGKHHRTYVDNFNNLVKDSPLDVLSLEEVLKSVAGDPAKAAIFNNGAQVWNHSFFWKGLMPNGGGKPTGDLLAKIEADFGSFEKMIEEIKTAAVTQFGSGWAWLIADHGKLKVMKTPNAETPVVRGVTPLLTIDVWEHAYYLDYQNRRADFVAAVLDKLVNWAFVKANLEKA